MCWGTNYHSFNTTDREQTVTLTFPAAFSTGDISGAAYLHSFPGMRMIITNYAPTLTTLVIYFYGLSGAPTSTAKVPFHWLAVSTWE